MNGNYIDLLRLSSDDFRSYWLLNSTYSTYSVILTLLTLLSTYLYLGLYLKWECFVEWIISRQQRFVLFNSLLCNHQTKVNRTDKGSIVKNNLSPLSCWWNQPLLQYGWLQVGLKINSAKELFFYFYKTFHIK